MLLNCTFLFFYILYTNATLPSINTLSVIVITCLHLGMFNEAKVVFTYTHASVYVSTPYAFAVQFYSVLLDTHMLCCSCSVRGHDAHVRPFEDHSGSGGTSHGP